MHLAHWFLRLALAGVFFYHGLTKFPKIEALSEMLKMSSYMVILLASLETVGAFLILAGGIAKSWVTRLGAIILIPVMAGAIYMMHWGQWSFMSTETHPLGGIEFQVTLSAILVYLLIRGNKA